MRALLLSLVALATLRAQDFEPYLKAQQEVNGFSGTALVARDGKVLLRKGVGLANREWNIAATPETKFRLGSITKQFTATAIMLLEQRGKLKVEDTLDKHVSDCPEAWKKVTIHQVLSHTSGIPSYTGEPAYASNKLKPTPPADLVALFRNRPLDFEPGAQYKYSNSGYSLLGFIIEKASGESYEAFLKKNIFVPLGMKSTGYDHNTEIVPMRASGYSVSGVKARNAEYVDMTIPYAAGALYSTVDDLYTWDQALYGDKVLPQEALKRMFTVVKNNYGYGWSIAKRDGRTMIGHGGGIDGFSTMIARYPEQKAAVIVLSNVEQVNAGRIATGLSALLFGEAVEMPKQFIEITLPAEALDKFTGVYEITPSFRLTVTREGNGLITQATGQGKIPIFPESESKFFARLMEAQITFEKGPDGKVNKLIIHQGGRNTPAKRVE